MLKVLFGEVTNGRLARLPYLGHLLLIGAIMFGVMFGIVALISSAEKIMEGSLQQIQAALLQKFGILFVIVMTMFFLTILFASMNITAKRIRDMGLWGWTTVLALAIAGGIVGTLFPGEMSMASAHNPRTPSPVSSAFQAVVLLCLLLIPSNSFGNKT